MLLKIKKTIARRQQKNEAAPINKWRPEIMAVKPDQVSAAPARENVHQLIVNLAPAAAAPPVDHAVSEAANSQLY